MTLPFVRRWVCVAAGSCLLTAAGELSADPLALVNLRWHAPAPCPDITALRAQLSLDLQGSQTNEALEVDAEVERNAEDDWLVHIRTRNAAGQSDRSLAARSCQALADATSLIVAMQIDPETAAAHARVIEGLSETASEPNRPPTNEPQVDYPAQRLQLPQVSAQRPLAVSETKTKQQSPYSAPSPHPVRSRAPLRGLVSAWLVRDWGSLPAATEIFGASIGLSHDSWLGEAAFGSSLREDVSSRGRPPVGTLGVMTGTLRACRRVLDRSRFSLGPCAGLQWARWSSQGNDNLVSQRSESAVTLSAEARLLGSLRLFEQLQLLVPFDVVLPLNRPRFGVMQATEQQVQIFEPSWIAIRVGAGLQLSFP